MKQERKPILESVLAKHMGRDNAPDLLWNRIQNPQLSNEKISARTSSMWMQWGFASAALVLLGTLSAGIWWVRNLNPKPTSPEAMAVAALAYKPDNLSLQTSDTTQIRNWVRTNSGIDIPLPPKHAATIQVIGARLIEGATPMAEVSYQVGGYRAALLVTKDPSGKRTYPNHGLRPSDPVETAHVSSWSMRGQSYTLASDARGEEFETACLLCHDQTPKLPSATRKI